MIYNVNMDQLLAHLIGDYWFQSHDMATKKINSIIWAFFHGVTYTIPFIFLTQDIFKLLIILITHVLIDRYRLANWIIKIKNFNFTGNGFPESVPAWLSVWLMIITDNTIHLLINYIVLI